MYQTWAKLLMSDKQNSGHIIEEKIVIFIPPDTE